MLIISGFVEQGLARKMESIYGVIHRLRNHIETPPNLRLRNLCTTLYSISTIFSNTFNSRTCTGFEYFHVHNISICSIYNSLKLSFPGRAQDMNTFMFTIFPFAVTTFLSNFHFQDVSRNRSL